MFITVYISEKLREYSEKSYDQGGVFFLDISENERDLCNILNGNELEGMYPKWDEVALCLHNDWKLIKSWQLAEGIREESVQRMFSRVFDRPDVLTSIKSALEMYSIQVHDYNPCLSHAKSRFSAIYCLNREIYKSLWWCFDRNDDSHIVLIEKILLDIFQHLYYELSKEVRKETSVNFSFKLA